MVGVGQRVRIIPFKLYECSEYGVVVARSGYDFYVKPDNRDDNIHLLQNEIE